MAQDISKLSPLKSWTRVHRYCSRQSDPADPQNWELYKWLLSYIIGVGNGNPFQYSCLENPTEEPGRLQSMGSQRVEHDQVTTHSTALTHFTFNTYLLNFALIVFFLETTVNLKQGQKPSWMGEQ